MAALSRSSPAFPHALPSSLVAARAEANGCTRCPLFAHAIQTVFGEGSPASRLMLVGEQPGNSEDLAGQPFVGLAGRLFDRALAEAGIKRGDVYVTNAVKHFKFEPRGKFRLHKKPNTAEIDACRWWLDIERSLIKPRLILALGASAAQSILRRRVTIGKERAQPIPLVDADATLWITVHPSYLLRVLPEQHDAEYERFVDDLVGARKFAA